MFYDLGCQWVLPLSAALKLILSSKVVNKLFQVLLGLFPYAHEDNLISLVGLLTD